MRDVALRDTEATAADCPATAASASGMTSRYSAGRFGDAFPREAARCGAGADDAGVDYLTRLRKGVASGLASYWPFGSDGVGQFFRPPSSSACSALSTLNDPETWLGG